MGTRPGPKSRVHTVNGNAFTISFWFFVWLYMLKGTGVHGVKVGDMSTISPGAAAAAKPCGGTDFLHSRPTSNNLAKQLVRKRAYRRALIRAQNYSTSMYRGRLVTAQQASWHRAPTLVQVRNSNGDRRPAFRQHGRGPRLRVCCHNLGGICTATYDGFCHWLETCSFDLVMVQETHFGLGKESTH